MGVGIGGLQGILDDSHALIDLGLADAERRYNEEDIVEQEGKKPIVVHPHVHPGRGTMGSLLVLA